MQEGDGEAIIAIVRCNESTKGATITYTTMKDTAVPGIDYKAKTARVVFEDETTFACKVTVPIIDEDSIYKDLFFYVKITEVEGGREGPHMICRVNIIDKYMGGQPGDDLTLIKETF